MHIDNKELKQKSIREIYKNIQIFINYTKYF